MNTKRLTEHDIDEAAAILRDGGLLGIPTETVYGLGANGLNEEAVAHILKPRAVPRITLSSYISQMPLGWRGTARIFP